MTERLVIQRTSLCWRFISRARLTVASNVALSLDALTPVGAGVMREIAAIDGARAGIADFLHHQVDVRLVHESLWSWDEVEPQVIAAFARVLGCDIEVIREDAGAQAKTETVVPEP